MRIILDCVIQVHYGLHNPELSQHFFLELPIQKRCNIILGSSNLEHKKKRATIMEGLLKVQKKPISAVMRDRDQYVNHH